MAIALLAGANGRTNGYAHGDVTTTAIDSTGATLFVAAMWQYGSTAPTGIADSKTNTWYELGSYGTGGVSSIRLAYSYDHGGSALSVGASHTFTIDGWYCTLMVLSFSGTDTTSGVYYGAVNGATGSNISSLQTGSVTPAASGDVLVVGWGCDSNTPSGLTMGGGFDVQVLSDTVVNTSRANAYLLAPSTSAINPAWTATLDNHTWATSIAIFKAAAAGGASVATKSLRNQAVKRASYY